MTVRNVALTAILLAGLAWSGPGAAQTRLNVQGGWATGGIFTEFEVPFWMETIPEKTGGAVTVRLTNLNEMGLKGPEVFRMMRLGLIDFGTSVLGYVAGDHPENGAPDLAGIANTAAEARAATEAWRPVLEELYTTKYQVTPIIFYPAEAQAVYCNTEIGSLADLQGKKVRVFTRSMADFLEAAGATPVTMSFGEVVTALQRGVIDCAVTGALSGNAAKWFEVSTHFFPLPLGWAVFMYGASTRSWEAMDPGVRSVIETEMKKLEDTLWNNGDYRTAQGIACNTGQDSCEKGTKANLTLVALTDADKARQKEIVESTVIARWAKQCGAACVERWNGTVGKVLGYTASAD